MSRTREQHDRRRERAHPPRSPDDRRPDTVWIYGLHAVTAALANPRRKIRRLLATPNALARLREAGAQLPPSVEETTPRLLDHHLGRDAVHQGAALETSPLSPLPLSAAADTQLVVVLDQITDPHNVGAILRSAVAFGAGAIVTASRHSAVEGGALAKAASGALDRIRWIEIQNLARGLEELGSMGFRRIGLDSDASVTVEDAVAGERIALVLGAEGKGLRRLTRDTCDVVAKLWVPGEIASLNVSNAAALALYVSSRFLKAASA